MRLTEIWDAWNDKREGPAPAIACSDTSCPGPARYLGWSIGEPPERSKWHNFRCEACGHEQHLNPDVPRPPAAATDDLTYHEALEIADIATRHKYQPELTVAHGAWRVHWNGKVGETYTTIQSRSDWEAHPYNTKALVDRASQEAAS